MPRAEYGRPADFLKDAFLAAGEFPPELSEWGALADRFRFDPPILGMPS